MRPRRLIVRLTSCLVLTLPVLAEFCSACSSTDEPAKGSGAAGASGTAAAAGAGGRSAAGGTTGGTNLAGAAPGQGGSMGGSVATSGAGGTIAGMGTGANGGTGAPAGAGGSASGAGGTSGTSGAGGHDVAPAGGRGGKPGTAGASGTGGTQSMTSGVAPVVSGGVRWFGRVDVSDASAQKFAWSGTGFSATVNGDSIAVKLRSDGGSDPIYFQPVIDGMPKDRISVASSEGIKTVVLATGLDAGDHVVSLYRETEAKPELAVSTFLGFTSGTLKDPPAYSGRLLEIVGDSISAGYGDLGNEQHPNGNADPSGGCHFSTATESAYVTYGAVAARALKADASIVALSGWGVYTDNLGNAANVLPKVYPNTLGTLASPAWSFAAKPQAVVVNLGTNDFAFNMSLGQAEFSKAYSGLLGSVRGKYPDALILCAIGPLLYGTGLTNATSYITAIVADLNKNGDQKVKVLNLGSQDASKGTGCDWHPNVAEQQRLADILSAELKTSLGW